MTAKNQRTYVKKKKAEGLVRKEFWIKPEWFEAIVKFITTLKD